MEETIKALPVRSCEECRFLVTSPYPTSDSFERPEYWWCKHPAMNYEFTEVDHETEKHRQNLINGGEPSLIRKIAGYVEWNDKPGIPDFCLLPNYRNIKV